MPDLFGRIILDALAGEPAEHLNERDDGYSSSSSGVQYIRPYTEWHTSERESIKCAEGPVLDLGCGGGRAGIHLRRRDIEYVGIDISLGALHACKKQGLTSILQMSMDHLGLQSGIFKTVLMFGNNFGIPGSKKGVVALLRELHRVSTSDAIVLAQSRDPKATDDPVHLKYHEKNRQRGKSPGLVRFRIKYQDSVSNWIDLLLCSPVDMATLAERASWMLERTFGNPKLYVGLLRKK